MRSCIATLTRGYTDIEKYSMLIKRNKHIARKLSDKTIDILIFHEGNIVEEHQAHIKAQTPELALKFIDISPIAFKKERAHIIVEQAKGGGLNYRHMCSFWFVEFWQVVKGYDKLLRIDEDCFIEFRPETVLESLDEHIFIVPQMTYDHEFVTIGLNTFSLEFIRENRKEYAFKSWESKPPFGPYTNVFGISLKEVRENKMFQKYMNEVDKRGMIYKRRWGDLPLWGEVIYYIFGMETCFQEKQINYYHQSHNTGVN